MPEELDMTQLQLRDADPQMKRQLAADMAAILDEMENSNVHEYSIQLVQWWLVRLEADEDVKAAYAK